MILKRKEIDEESSASTREIEEDNAVKRKAIDEETKRVVVLKLLDQIKSPDTINKYLSKLVKITF